MVNLAVRVCWWFSGSAQQISHLCQFDDHQIGVVVQRAFCIEQPQLPHGTHAHTAAPRAVCGQPVAQAADGGALAGFADLQATGYIDHFFVAPAFARQGVARLLMSHIHVQAAARGITQLHADVSLTAEPFFAATGFVVHKRQEVARAGAVLCNARMVKALVQCFTLSGT